MWVKIEERVPSKWGMYHVFSNEDEVFTASWRGKDLGFTDSDGERLTPEYESISHWFDFSFVRNPEVESNVDNLTPVEWFAELVTEMGYVSTDVLDQAKEMETRGKHKSIDKQVSILKDTLEELMINFDSEEDRVDFILDICNGYKKRIDSQLPTHSFS